MQVITKNSGTCTDVELLGIAYDYLLELVRNGKIDDKKAEDEYELLFNLMPHQDSIEPEKFIYQFNKIEQLHIANGKCEYFAPFSPVALAALEYSDAYINIFEGAVRSGKTVCSIVVWINFIAASEHREFLMTGKTVDTLYRNVLDGKYGVLNLLGSKAEYKKSSEGGAKLVINFDGVEKVCYCRGASDIKAEGNIRGMTIGGWYADEVVLYPESFINQGINRMSLDGAKAFWTTNPDSPYHFIKTNFIDCSVEKGYRIWHFELDDNYALSRRYKDSLKKAYSGLWHQRMVKGLWVMADGVIYGMFEDRMIVDEIPDIVEHWITVDYGTSNATVFLHCGRTLDNKFYILDEYYHSGSDGHTKSPSQYTTEFKDFVNRIKTNQGGTVKYDKIFIDPSAEAFIAQLYVDGVRGVQGADNSVKTGIELVSNLIGNDAFRILRRCKHTIQEITSYVWDEKAQLRGIDQPLKKNDHCMDALRYNVATTKHIWLRKAA